MMRWPGQIPAGRKTAALAQMFDIYPTIVEAAGGKLSPGHFAQSMLPVATGRKASVRDAVFSEISNRGELNYMARTQRYAWWVHQGKEALYDMESDPYQMNNLVASAAHRQALQDVRLRHLEYFKATQVNLSADYRPMIERTTEESGGKTEGLADRIYKQYRKKQGLDR
jgi:arylsulfatase A-like enzyme